MDRFAAACEEIASYRSRLRKIEILADYLRELNDDDFYWAVQFLSSGPIAESASPTLFATGERPRLSIGGSILREALEIACKWDRATVRICHREVGDTGELAGLLMHGLSREAALSLFEANQLYQDLFQTRTRAGKVEILVGAYFKYRPSTIKYFVKVITRALRIGLMGHMVEEAVAKACGTPHQDVRDANNRLGDLARVAVAARRAELGTIGVALFHPMDFMLAKPLDRLEDISNPAEWLVEDKFDGIRSQVHFDSGRVQIFSRGMEEITHSFPEILKAFEFLEGKAIVDGEILAYRDQRPLSFNLLQQRIARKRVRTTHLQDIPVVFVAYDLLLRGEELLLHHALGERRSRLMVLFENLPSPLLISNEHKVSTVEEIEALFSSARARGNEGLLLKRRTGIYEPGRRSGAWFKLKRPYGTLDVVVTAAEQGSGRRAIFLSDYTFAVRSSQGYVNVGKAYSGLTDVEVRDLTKILRAASTEKFGRVLLVRPEVVLEVAFDGVQKSGRHKGGYALRFPRILRWRQDKKPEDSDDLDRVETLYKASLQ